jgi:hypothetical protein
MHGLLPIRFDPELGPSGYHESEVTYEIPEVCTEIELKHFLILDRKDQLEDIEVVVSTSDC